MRDKELGYKDKDEEDSVNGMVEFGESRFVGLESAELAEEVL